MGGNKHKGQAQRTKNNAKPSSSGRIAELVDKGHQFPSFSGFSETRSTLNPVASNITTDIFGPNVDPNFSVVLKKMNKKDATTRYKALQELKELLGGSEGRVVEEVLPVWCKVYTLLAVDVEHRVREAVQEVHRLVVRRVGRNLAPHLKLVAPLWFLSQYDSYPPAASVASASFQEAFPPHKVIEVIAFCQAEILHYIHENLLALTPQALSKGDLTKEEMDLKYERIIICSLNGLALYLSKVPVDHINKSESLLREILSSNKFWKFSKYKTPGVRGAWFALLSSICQHAAHLLENEKKHVANSVISAIDDYDSSVLSIAWEAALRSFSAIQDFWEHINIDKFFLPKFANILRVGGQGNASCIYPNVLLLLNSIPSHVIKDNQQFFQKIFTSFRDGMKQPLVYQSPSESEAVMSSFLECIKYVVLKNLEDHQFTISILQQLYNVISSSMTESSFRNLIKPLYRHLYQLLLFWQKNENSDKYVTLHSALWENMSNISIANLMESLVDKDLLQLCINSQLLMLSVLDCPTTHKHKLKVSFADMTNKELDSPKENSLSRNIGCSTVHETKMEKEILDFAEILLKAYYKLALDTNYKHYQIMLIVQIEKISKLFDGKSIERLKTVEPEIGNSLLAWLECGNVPATNLLELVFDVVIFLDEVQQEVILSHLTQGTSNESLVEGLKLATKKDNKLLVNWLGSEEIKDKICHEFDKMDSEECSSFLIVKSAFLLNSNGDFVVGNNTAVILIKKVEEYLSSHDEKKIRLGAEAINEILGNIFGADRNNYEAVILRLLECLFVNIVGGTGTIVYQTWHKGILLLSKHPSGQQHLELHLKSISNQLGIYITSMETIFDVKLIHSAMVMLLSILVGNDSTKMETFGLSSIRFLLSSVFTKAVEDSKDRIEEVCMVAEVINGNLSFNENSSRMNSMIVEIIEKWNPLNSVNTLGFLNSLVFSLKIIATTLGIDIDSDGICGEDEDDFNQIITLPSLPKESTEEFCEYLVELTYGLVLLKKVETYYYATKEYFDIACFVEPLEKDLRELVQRCQHHEQEKIVNMINTNVNSKGCLWNQVKDKIMEFLDGTVQECSIVLKDNESMIPNEILSVPHIHKLRSIIKSKGLDKILLNETLKIVIDRYRQEYPVFDEKLNDVGGNYLILSAEIARLIEAAIATSPLLLSQSVWDFARISVVGWLHRIAITQGLQDNYIEFVTLTNAACSLLITLSKTLIDESHSSYLSSYFEEWKEVFAADAFYYLCKSWEVVIEERCSNLNYVGFIHVETLGKTICELCELEPLCQWKSRSNLREWVKLAITGLLIPFVPVQISSYKLLLLLLPAMMELDEGIDETSLDSVSCCLLEEKLLATQMVVMAMLQDFNIGISCSVAPFTDSYVYTLGYLLLWSTLIQFCQQCQTQQKYLYPLWIKEKNIVSSFIEAIVKLMPECVLYYQDSNNKKGQELFTSPPSFSFGAWTSEKLGHLCCWLLTELMGYLPAVVRQWASEAEPKQLNYLDRIATAFVSPYLTSREMDAIKGQQKSFENMKVFTYPSVGEVIAVYTVEESSTELSIQLSSNYPLSPPKVDISKAMVSSIQTRQWLKQLTIFLTHQNGSIWDGLILWKNNLDKKFEGIDECYICFSILHTTTHQLPKLSCHTCKKKFHSYCLYKWFSTSNKSTCPICRAIF